MIELKSASEIALMRKAGRVVAGLLDTLAGLVQPGIKTKALDEAARTYLHDQEIGRAHV